MRRRHACVPVVSLIGVEPVTNVESYDSVPLYRKQWFALFPLFILAIPMIASTGSVYCKANGAMKEYSEANVWRYTPVARAFFVVEALLVILFVANALWG